MWLWKVKVTCSVVHLFQCIYKLCEFRCNLEAVNKDNETALMVMVKNSSLDCVMGLLAKCANADVQDKQGNSPLHRAIEVCMTSISLGNWDTL